MELKLSNTSTQHALGQRWPNYGSRVVSGLSTSLIWPAKYLPHFRLWTATELAIACRVNCTVSGQTVANSTLGLKHLATPALGYITNSVQPNKNYHCLGL